ncbi:hypothetical protein [Pediococcus pentosaceus]|uniref:hypothetical protein n=1 Tax=Pediococcus pentosaceus TaxID=1255 RepID=UPI000852E0FF|nr:hypothetical protein [Pediococcus pentosaceus]
MSIEDFKKMECIDRIKLIRSCIRQAGFENPDEHLGACLAVLDRFEISESSKKDNNNYTVTAKLECEDVSFSETLNKAQQVVDTMDASLKSVNEALDEFQSKLSDLGLIMDEGKIVSKLNCEM